MAEDLTDTPFPGRMVRGRTGAVRDDRFVEGGSRSMTKDRRSTFRCARLAAAALALGLFSSTGLTSVSAQDASPAAVACVSPGLPPGTPTPMDEMGDMDMGTP